MIRLSLRRCASAYREILTGDKATAFIDEVSSRIATVRGESPTLEAAHGSGPSVSSENASSSTISYWEGIRRAAVTYGDAANELAQLEEMTRDNDAEMARLAEADRPNAEAAADEAAEELAKQCQMEFSAGVGGSEAMLFTAELYEMYRKYSEWRGWQWSPLQVDEVPSGGMRAAIVSIVGADCYAFLRFEAGVHRVQRMPLTDKSRIHTSTSSIAVLPEPEEVSVLIPPNSVTIEAMRASGPGGQNVNKRSSAVRMTHKETGIAVHVMDERYQHMNMQIAFARLAAILMQKKVDAAHDKFSSERKMQVGSRGRAEKIRTYNFKDDRITDHRLRIDTMGIEDFMRGTDPLHNLVQKLNDAYNRERLVDIIKHRILE